MSLLHRKSIAVIGGGNIGTQFACIFSSKGFNVSVYTSRPHEWHHDIETFSDDGSITKGYVHLVSDSIEEVLRDREVIFVTYPAFMFRKLSEMIYPHIHTKVFIGVIPGTGGAEFAFSKCMDKGAVLFGIQRVPSVARIITYGKSVRTEGKRSRLKLSAIPQNESQYAAALMSEVFDMPCDVLSGYLNVTLTPSNPILHTSRLCTLFHDYSDGMIYPENPLFYGSWNDESSRLLFKLDNELQRICELLEGFDLSEVKSLRLHYESNTPEQLTQKIQSIKSLNKLRSPMKECAGGFIPDFDSRYFTADFPFGLAIIESIAELLKYNAENVTRVMKWYHDVSGDKSHFRLENFGIRSLEDFYAKYQQKGLDKMQNRIIIDKTRQDKTRQDN